MKTTSGRDRVQCSTSGARPTIGSCKLWLARNGKVLGGKASKLHPSTIYGKKGHP